MASTIDLVGNTFPVHETRDCKGFNGATGSIELVPRLQNSSVSQGFGLSKGPNNLSGAGCEFLKPF